LPDEFSVIERFFAPLATARGALGLKDDVALLAPDRAKPLVLTTDAVIEGVDFFPSDPADLVARKALRVNLSDLAAKGATPLGYLLTLALRRDVSPAWLKRFTAGLAEDQRKYRLALYGGDLSSTRGPITIAITAFGRPTGVPVLRGGAKLGDLVFTTGTIGDSGAGLAALKAGQKAPALIERYRLPQPRMQFGARLPALASASLDVSDGLLADLGHLAQESGVRIDLEAFRIPLSGALKKYWGQSLSTICRAVSAGDDYEIAFTAPRRRLAAIERTAGATKTRVSVIGKVIAGSGVRLLDREGRAVRLNRRGWRHF
jgi:thiamine-monophosphate kinase